MKNYTDRQLIELIDQSLKATAKDVREGRVPLDGRARMPLPEDAEVVGKPQAKDAAE